MRVANRKARLSGTNTLLYSLSKQTAGANFHPITAGTNGACGALCTASTGYDYVTGIGTPVAASLITPGDLVYTSVILTIPLYLLYEVSIGLSYIVFRRREKKRLAEEAAEALT